MMNQKRELTDTISCLTMEIPGRQTTSVVSLWHRKPETGIIPLNKTITVNNNKKYVHQKIFNIK